LLLGVPAPIAVVSDHGRCFRGAAFAEAFTGDHPLLPNVRIRVKPAQTNGVIGGRVAFPHRHLRRGEVVDRQPRWRGAAFLLRTGKRLAASEQRVSHLLRDPVGPMSGHLPAEANVLSFSLSGAGEIDPSLVVKKPGTALNTDKATTRVALSELPGANPLSPYVRLIHDVLRGDWSLFTRPDKPAAAWQVVQPALPTPPRVAPTRKARGARHRPEKLTGPGRWLMASSNECGESPPSTPRASSGGRGASSRSRRQ
jgi:hypothetical protein